METGQGAVGSSSLTVPKFEESRFKLFPPLLLCRGTNDRYIKGTNRNKDVYSLTLTDIYPYDPARYVPIIESLDKEILKIWASIRCLVQDIDEPRIK